MLYHSEEELLKGEMSVVVFKYILDFFKTYWLRVGWSRHGEILGGGLVGAMEEMEML